MRFINQMRINRILASLSIILLLVSACGNPHINSGKNENADLQQALWIGDTREWPVDDSLMYGEFPAPVFRKEFTAKKDLKSVKLFITAAGYYSASINGEKAGKNYVDPAWTNFKKRIHYTEYEFTDNVK